MMLLFENKIEASFKKLVRFKSETKKNSEIPFLMKKKPDDDSEEPTENLTEDKDGLRV